MPFHPQTQRGLLGRMMMDFYSSRQPRNGLRYGLGFKSKTQLPLLMIWEERWADGEVYDARVIYSTGWRRKA